MIKVSQEIYDGLEACRKSGEYNMFSRIQVILWLQDNSYWRAAEYVQNNKREYSNGILFGFEVE